MQDKDDDDEQGRTWEWLYESVKSILAQYGTEDAFGRGDYLIVDDNYGWKSVLIAAQRLGIFNPVVVQKLRALLADLPDWEIVMAVDVPGKEKEWPKMGLTIRKHEIIDGLQRNLLPEFANVQYEGGRPGTGDD